MKFPPVPGHTPRQRFENLVRQVMSVPKTKEDKQAIKRPTAKRRAAKALLVIIIALLASTALAGQSLPRCGDGNGDSVICARGLPRCSKHSDTSPHEEIVPSGDNDNLSVLVNTRDPHHPKPICWLAHKEEAAMRRTWLAECRRRPHRLFTTRPNGFPGCWDTVDECGDKVSETCTSE